MFTMWGRLFLASMLIASVSAVAFPANLRGVLNVTTREPSLVGLPASATDTCEGALTKDCLSAR